MLGEASSMLNMAEQVVVAGAGRSVLDVERRVTWQSEEVGARGNVLDAQRRREW